GTNATELTVKYNLDFLPKITDQVFLSKIYSTADFTLILSKKETFSLVTADSLSCGTPVIGFDAGGPTEIAINNFGRFTVNGDYEKLKELVYDSIEGNITYGSKDLLRNHIINNYSLKAMVKKYENLYLERL
ncbi:MAG: glycosyltransferase, partial [Tissierellia bacterium]|nr:glycosyltransferase [Tissierellia bacterium]